MRDNGSKPDDQDAPESDKVSVLRAAPNISESIRRLAIDLPYLRTLPRGGGGSRAWPADWVVAAQLLYVNGWSPTDIARHLDGPQEATIQSWANAGGWSEMRVQHRKALAEKSLAKMEEGRVEIIAPHLKYMRALESVGMKAALDGSAEAKSLEGTILAIVTAVKMERAILGLEHAPEPKVEDHRTQVIIAEMNSLAPGQLKDYFAAMRKKLEAETTIKELVSGDVIEGEVVEPEVVARGEPDDPETRGG